MMMIRRLRMLCLALLLLGSLLPAGVLAQAANTYSLTASSGSVQAGENVSVTVAGQSLTDVYGAELKLQYDPAKLQYTGYTSSLSGEAFVAEPNVNGNEILLLFTYTGQRSGITGDRSLFTLTFKALEAGTASISLSSVKALNSQEQTVSSTIGSGAAITVTTAAASTSPTPSPTPSSNNNGSGGGNSSDNGGGGANSSSSGSNGNGSGPNRSYNEHTVVSVQAAISNQGVAAVSIAEKDLLAAAGQSKSKAVEIQVTTTAQAKEVEVTLPAAIMVPTAHKDRSVEIVSIQTGIATVAINTKMLDNLQVSESSKLQLAVSKVDQAALSSDVARKVGSSTVYDFQLSVDGQKLSTGFNGNIKVELPYTLAPGEKPNQVVIYYISDSGSLEVVKNGRYHAETGMVEFKPNHFSKYMANYAKVSFRDMDGYAWAEEAVLGLAAREVVQGRSEGVFAPDAPITRAEFVQILVKLFDLEDASAAAAFHDVHPEAWYYSAVASAQKAGLVQGKADGSFGVNDRISREDMAVLIYRAAQRLGSTTDNANNGEDPLSSYADQERISGYAREAVSALLQAGIMNGMVEGSFSPKGSATRAQAVSVLYRLFLNWS